MALADDKTSIYTAVTKEVKERLQEQAEKNHRSLSKEVAYIIDWYFEEKKKK